MPAWVRFLIITMLWAIPQTLAFGTGHCDETQIQVIPNAAYQETEYCIVAATCYLCWKTYQNDLNRSVLQNRSRCNLALDLQTPWLEKLLGYILTCDKDRDQLTSFFWGRLTPDQPQDALEMSFRLTLAASRSSGWDSQNGRPRQVPINTFIRNLANQAAIYPELNRVFEHSGRCIEVSSVEKVLVLPAAQLPFFDQLKTQGVGPAEKLPFDCLVWFQIKLK
jgi:hypothetical protein